MLTFKKLIMMFALNAFVILTSHQVNSDSLDDYVDDCKKELKFSQKIPDLNCLGTNTVSTPITDGQMPERNDLSARLGYTRINDSVDAVFICRIVDTKTNSTFSAAMIINNRRNGKTCFFESKHELTGVTYASPEASNAANYWRQPALFSSRQKTVCTDCHVRGPYLIPTHLSSAFARFGLMNNGRDLIDSNYQAVSDLHSHWNDDIDTTSTFGCSESCHARTGGDREANFLEDANHWDSMPPNPLNGSNYLWVNADTPGASGDWETKSRLLSQYPFALPCTNPNSLIVRAVGKNRTWSTTSYPDNLQFFNIHDGLVCKRADQKDNTCSDYSVSYMCDGKWTPWSNQDRPSGTGDYESRRKLSGSQTCDNPKDIRAKVGTKVYYGFYDRINKFSVSYGFSCVNKDQPTGHKCKNYTIKYNCPL